MNVPKALDPLFRPQSIILIGAAQSEEKLGGIILKNLLRYRGGIYPVNPKYNQLLGIKSYPSVKAISELSEFSRGAINLAIIIRPASEVPGILRELQPCTKTAIIVSSGFSEIGQAGLQDEVKNIGKETGIRLLGPNCLGVYNAHKKLDTLFISREKLGRPKKGNVAVLSQSGAVMACLFGAIRSSNTGISKAVGYGNAVDIDESDFYDYLALDPHTDIVISYLESLGDGRKFIKAARSLSDKKTLLVLKSGKGFSGQAAAFSHTGRLAGRYEVFSSILRQFGIKEAVDLEDLVDGAKALSYQKPARPHNEDGPLKKEAFPGRARVCIVTNGGGSGVLAADECTRQMLDVVKVSEEKVKKLRDVFPPFYPMSNPIDLTAQVKDTDYAAVLEMLKDDYDGFVIIALTAVTGVTTALAGLIRDFKESSGKAVVLYTDPGRASRSMTALFEKAGIPVYPSPERAVRGLKALLF